MGQKCPGPPFPAGSAGKPSAFLRSAACVALDVDCEPRCCFPTQLLAAPQPCSPAAHTQVRVQRCRNGATWPTTSWRQPQNLKFVKVLLHIYPPVDLSFFLVLVASAISRINASICIFAEGRISFSAGSLQTAHIS